MKYDAFIFDVDGVLLDTSTSFNQAVLLAVKTATGSNRFTKHFISTLKGIPGFNNDWNVAIAGAAWIESGDSVPFSEFVNRLNRYGGGLKALKKIISSLSVSFQQSITKLVMEAYGGTSACKQLYGFEPETIHIEGTWKNETAFISPEKIRPYLPISGIVSGRNRTEMDLAFKLLGWEIPAQRVAISDDAQLDKPNPKKLISIINTMGSENPVFLGDTRDDMELVKNVVRETGKQMDFCCVGNQNGINDFDYQVETVLQFFEKMETANG